MQLEKAHPRAVARKSRRLTERERSVRLRIAAYAYREWLRFRANEPDGKQEDFARLAGLDDGTVSKIVTRKLEKEGAGLNIAIALVFNRDVDAKAMFKDDPILPKARGGEASALGGAPSQSPARRHGSGR